MYLIVGLLSALAAGSLAWTLIQIFRPELFFRAEEAANLNGRRPWWYMAGGIAMLIVLVLVWVQAFQLRLVSVWIVTGLMTLGGVKALGIVFFYQRFSSGVTVLVNRMAESRATYVTTVLTRGALSVALSLLALYFAGYFGPVR